MPGSSIVKQAIEPKDRGTKAKRCEVRYQYKNARRNSRRPARRQENAPAPLPKEQSNKTNRNTACTAGAERLVFEKY